MHTCALVCPCEVPRGPTTPCPVPARPECPRKAGLGSPHALSCGLMLFVPVCVVDPAVRARGSLFHPFIWLFECEVLEERS
eukprot:6920955-Alexandrium_andersonii.AAC.1